MDFGKTGGKRTRFPTESYDSALMRPQSESSLNNHDEYWKMLNPYLSKKQETMGCFFHRRESFTN